MFWYSVVGPRCELELTNLSLLAGRLLYVANHINIKTNPEGLVLPNLIQIGPSPAEL